MPKNVQVRIRKYIGKNLGAPFIATFMFSLIVNAFFLSVGHRDYATVTSIAGYTSLVIGIILQLFFATGLKSLRVLRISLPNFSLVHIRIEAKRYFKENPGALFTIVFIFSLVSITVFLAMKKNELAIITALLGYLSLITGIILQIFSLFRSKLSYARKQLRWTITHMSLNSQDSRLKINIMPKR